MAWAQAIIGVLDTRRVNEYKIFDMIDREADGSDSLEA